MPPQPEKHLPYFEVLDALKAADGCAVCWQVAKATRLRLESLLYESVTDKGTSEQVRQSHGYCQRHTELLIASGDALGVALLHRPVLIAWREHLDSIPAEPPFRFLGQGRDNEWSASATCPFCAQEQTLATRTSVTITEWMADEGMAEALAAAPPFCPVHFQAVLVRCATTAQREAFLADERAKIASLHTELERLIDSYQTTSPSTASAPTGSESEKDSWIRTARLIANARRPQ